MDDHWPAFKAVALTVWDRLVEDTEDQSSDGDEDTIETHSDDENHMHSDESDEDIPDEGERTTASTRRKGGNALGRRKNMDGLTEVTINGHRYRINLNSPFVEDWLRYQIEYLNYQRQAPRWSSP